VTIAPAIKGRFSFEGLKPARRGLPPRAAATLPHRVFHVRPLQDCVCHDRAKKDSAYVEAFFVSRASAVERVVLARRALMKELDAASAGAFALSQGPSLLDRLEQLLLDVRAGRVSDFVMPSLTSKVRIVVMSD
jgi:hypothetical protein